MQLVEQNKLSLDEDVNTYLDFKIPPAFGKPITLRNLMTDTAGFEDTRAQSRARRRTTADPLETYVRTHIPKRIYPPGEVRVLKLRGNAHWLFGATHFGQIVRRVRDRKHLPPARNEPHDIHAASLPPSSRPWFRKVMGWLPGQRADSSS
jgi:hypothetical protein